MISSGEGHQNSTAYDRQIRDGNLYDRLVSGNIYSVEWRQFSPGGIPEAPGEGGIFASDSLISIKSNLPMETF